MDSEEFYLTLTSAQDTEYFSENSPSRFHNYMKEPLDISGDEYKVGLAQIKMIFKAPTPTLPKTEQPFYKEGATEKKATLWKRTDSYLIYPRQNKTILMWIGYVSSMWKEAHYQLYLHKEAGAEKFKAKLVINTGIGERIFTMSEKVAKILGFKNTQFRPGEFIGEDYLDEQLFETTGPDERLTFTVTHWKEEEFTIQQPKSWNVADVLEALSKGLETIPVGRVKLSIFDSELLINLLPNVQMRLPPEFNTFFGFQPNHVMNSGRTRVKYPEDPMTKPPENMPEVPTVVHVYCDILEPFNVGVKTLPILRSIYKDSSTDVITNFNPVFYMRPRSEHLRHIQVQLLDKDFQVIPNCIGTTVVVLHIKRI